MKKVVKKLYELQQLDIQVQEIKHDPIIKTLSSEVEDLLNKIDDLVEEMDSLREKMREKSKEIKRKDHEEQSIDERRDELEEEMYSGKSGAKEVSQIQRKILSMGAQKEALTDEILLLLEEVDTLEANLEDLTIKTRGYMEEKKKKEEDLEEKKRENRERLESLMKKRGELEKKIEPEYREIYQEIKENRGGQAVASVKGSYCLGCRVGLPATTIDTLFSGDTLVYCESCKRILFLKR